MPLGNIKDHPVIVVLGMIVAAFGAGAGTYEAVLRTGDIAKIPKSELTALRKASTDLQSCKQSGDCIASGVRSKLPAGQEVLFYIDQVYSQALWDRDEKVLDKKWDAGCRTTALKAMIALGFTPHPVQSEVGARSEVDGTYLGVQCESQWDHAVIFGMAMKAEYPKLRAYAVSLKEQLKVQGTEFK